MHASVPKRHARPTSLMAVSKERENQPRGKVAGRSVPSCSVHRNSLGRPCKVGKKTWHSLCGLLVPALCHPMGGLQAEHNSEYMASISHKRERSVEYSPVQVLAF